MDIFTPTKSYLMSRRPKDLHAISEASGVPFHTILKIRNGETQNPGVLTIEAIYKAIVLGKAA